MDGTPVAAVTTADGSSDAPQSTTYVRVAAVDDAVAAISAVGGRTLLGPVDNGALAVGRCVPMPVAPPFGVVQTGGPLVARRVNEPGAWNFSELVTSELQQAIAFYGRVFGWEVDRERHRPQEDEGQGPGYGT